MFALSVFIILDMALRDVAHSKRNPPILIRLAVSIMWLSGLSPGDAEGYRLGVRNHVSTCFK